MSPFKGKKHSEKSKRLMGFAKTGVMRSATERRRYREKYKTAWRQNNPEKVEQYDKRSLEPRAQANAKRRMKYRLEAIRLLGGRCSSKNCKWVNDDGTTGCNDWRLLQLDHKKGGGTQERKLHSFEYLCRKVIQGKRKDFQLLCSNCNWLKAFEKKEFKYKYRKQYDMALTGL
jgi:hypothetical protein